MGSEERAPAGESHVKMEPQIDADSRRSSASDEHDLYPAPHDAGTDTTSGDLDEVLSSIAGAVHSRPVHSGAPSDDPIPPRRAWGWIAYPVALLGALFIWLSVIAFEAFILLPLLMLLYRRFGTSSFASYILGGALFIVLSIIPSIAATLSFRGTLFVYMPERYLALTRRRQRRQQRHARS